MLLIESKRRYGEFGKGASWGISFLLPLGPHGDSTIATLVLYG